MTRTRMRRAPIFSNPSTAGIQPTNRPDERSMPHGEYEKRVARG
jgi:hypothetical protein